MIYVMNTSIIPNIPQTWNEKRGYVSIHNMTVEQVKDMLGINKFISAVGHQGTVDVLRKLLNVNIELNRLNVIAKEGDILICFKLKQRLEEGRILTAEETAQMDFEFIKIRFPEQWEIDHHHQRG